VLPGILWRLKFAAKVHDVGVATANLVHASPDKLGEALTHPQVLSLPMHPDRAGCRLYHYERLEFLGDAVLKLLAVVQAAALSPTSSEDIISKDSQELQTKKWLRKCAKSLGLLNCLLARSFTANECMTLLRKQTVSQKVQADIMESVLGATFWCSTDQHAPLQQGVEDAWQMFQSIVAETMQQERQRQLDTFPEALLAGAATYSAETEQRRFHIVDAVASAMGYRFKDPGLLAAIFVRQGGSKTFERMEIVGDAFLQAAVSWHIATEFPTFNDGQLSELRAAYVCNRYLGIRFVRRFGQHLSYRLFRNSTVCSLVATVATKICSEAEQGDFVIGKNYISGETRLKVVADAYEALVAAVLVDSNGNLDETWKVFETDFSLPRDVIEQRMLEWRNSARELAGTHKAHGKCSTAAQKYKALRESWHGATHLAHSTDCVAHRQLQQHSSLWCLCSRLLKSRHFNGTDGSKR